MKISCWLLATFCLAMFSGCGNRYYKNYSGERFPKTKWCNLISAEVEYYNTGITLEAQARQLQSEGYRVIGSGSCKGRKLNAKHQKKIVKACQAIGGNKALYDSQRILYLREMSDSKNEEKEDDARSKYVRRKDYINKSLLCNKFFYNSKGFYWNPIAEKCERFQGRTETVKEICESDGVN